MCSQSVPAVHRRIAIHCLLPLVLTCFDLSGPESFTGWHAAADRPDRVDDPQVRVMYDVYTTAAAGRRVNVDLPFHSAAY